MNTQILNINTPGHEEYKELVGCYIKMENPHKIEKSINRDFPEIAKELASDLKEDIILSFLEVYKFLKR